MPISRRRFLGSIAAAGIASAQRDRPNIVFFLTDDQRWDSLGCMGNPIVRTPHIDRLSSQGVTFLNHFVTTAICMTSRASIFTGLYARAHGIVDFAKPLSEAQFARTYPSLLREAGYRTGFIGKYGVGRDMPAERFDYWKGFPGQGHYFPNGPTGKHLTEIMGDQAIQFLDGSPRSKPFCLSVSFKAPHVQDEDPAQFLPSRATADLYSGVNIPVPKTADPKYIAMLPEEVQRSEGRRRWAVRFGTPALYQESVKKYYRLISEVDTVVGRVCDALARNGLDRNTVIVYTGDNGFYLAEHGLAGKWLMHEESIRVPMIVYDPRLGNASQGLRRNEMTLNIDIAPTLLEAAGVNAPAGVQGRSLSPLCVPGAQSWRREFFYEHEFTANGWIPATEGVRTERWKYTKYGDTASPFEELFDLRTDRLEERNLAGAKQHSAQLEAMRACWSAWRHSLASWKQDTAWTEPRPEGAGV